MTLVIVGAGQAGARAAEALRQQKWGGRIVLVGEESWLPYERPPLSKAILSGEQDAQSATLLAAPLFAELDIELRLGTRVVRIDREARLVEMADATTVPYRSLILATGLRSRPLVGFDLGESLFHLRGLDDARRLRQALGPAVRVLVVGGGFLGLEIAATARGLGCEVTLVERNPSLLYRSVAPVIGDYVARLHHDHGVRIVTGTVPKSLTRIDRDGRSVVDTELANGERLEVDIVVAATGSIVNSELAESSGLEVDDGIIVDQFGRSSDPNIFAVGDVSRHFNPILGKAIRLESWQNAQDQAIAIARVIAGAEQPYAAVPWFWTDQFDMNLQIVGYPSHWERVIIHGNPAGGRFTALYLLGERVVGANMVNNGRDLRITRDWVTNGTEINPQAIADGLPLKKAARSDPRTASTS